MLVCGPSFPQASNTLKRHSPNAIAGQSSLRPSNAAGKRWRIGSSAERTPNRSFELCGRRFGPECKPVSIHQGRSPLPGALIAATQLTPGAVSRRSRSNSAQHRRLARLRDDGPKLIGQRSKVPFGSYLAVPLTSAGGLLSGVKLKKEDQRLTLGSKVACHWKAALLRSDLKRPPVAQKPTFSGNVTYAFSSRFSSLTKRQSVPSASSAFGLLRSMPASCRRSA